MTESILYGRKKKAIKTKEKFPKNKDEMRIFLMAKRAEFLLKGGKIKKIDNFQDTYQQFMEIDDRDDRDNIMDH